MNPEQERQIHQAILNGHKVQAIKLYRAATGLSLLDAKEAVEALEVKMGVVPAKVLVPEGVKTSKGCLTLVATVAAAIIYVLSKSLGV